MLFFGADEALAHSYLLLTFCGILCDDIIVSRNALRNFCCPKIPMTTSTS